MYVREKKVRRKDKEYRYYQLCQSTWVEGKSRQTVIQHLGPFATWDAATSHAKTAGYICGAEGYFEEPAEVRDGILRGPRGGNRGKCIMQLCEEHALELTAGGTVWGYTYDPEKAEQARILIRKPPAGGRPPFQLQDRTPAEW